MAQSVLRCLSPVQLAYPFNFFQETESTPIRGKFTDEEKEQLKEFFKDYFNSGEHPKIGACRPYLTAYPNPRQRCARDVRDKLRLMISKKE